MKTLLFSFFAMILLVSYTPPAGYQVGEKVADFKLKNIDGKMVALSDYQNVKGFIVVFTCNHCPFAKAYEDRIIDLDKKYSGKGYPVVAINPNDVKVQPDDSYEKMQERAKEKKFTFSYLYDESQSVAKAFGATRTPHIFILNKEKENFIVKYIGAIDDNTDDPSAVKTKYVENALDEIMNGKSVSQNFTKAVGCTIKWKKQ